MTAVGEEFARAREQHRRRVALLRAVHELSDDDLRRALGLRRRTRPLALWREALRRGAR